MSGWKAGDWAAVKIKGLSHDPDIMCLHAGTCAVFVTSVALHPLPTTAPEDAVIIEAATEVEKRIAQVKSEGPAMHGLYFAALEKLYAVVRARNATRTPAQQETKMEHVPQDSAWQPAASPDIPTLERAVVEAAMEQQRLWDNHPSTPTTRNSGDAYSLAIIATEEAAHILRMTLNPAPVDRMAKLREAAENAAIRLRVDAMILRANHETQSANEADDSADRLRAALAAMGER